jgi:hypothetical protein
MSDWVIAYGDDVDWAIDARQIQRIASRGEWTGALFDPGVLWGRRPAEATRVVVIDERLALAAGKIGFRALDGERVVPLPREWDARTKRFVEGIIFEDDGHALVVLHLEGLKWHA